jgi:hypothetical protein
MLVLVRAVGHFRVAPSSSRVVQLPILPEHRLPKPMLARPGRDRSGTETQTSPSGRFRTGTLVFHRCRRRTDPSAYWLGFAP